MNIEVSRFEDGRVQVTLPGDLYALALKDVLNENVSRFQGHPTGILRAEQLRHALEIYLLDREVKFPAPPKGAQVYMGGGNILP